MAGCLARGLCSESELRRLLRQGRCISDRPFVASLDRTVLAEPRPLYLPPFPLG